MAFSRSLGSVAEASIFPAIHRSMKRTSLRSLLLAALLLVSAPAAQGTPSPDLRTTLRIRLLEQLTPQSAVIQAGPHGIAVTTQPGGQPLFHLGPGQSMEVTRRETRIVVEGAYGRHTAPDLFLEPLGPGDTTLRVAGTSRSYAGSLHLSVDSRGATLRFVNHVPLEDYVASVVASEYGLPDLEGSKAMAVIARTYGLKVIGSTDDSYDHVDHTASQVYRGSRAVTATARRAAEETRGEVLTHNGRLIEAVYSSSSGGHTANNEDVWNSNPHPYLRGRKDPWDRESKYHRWEFSVAESTLHGALTSALGREVTGVSVAARSADGRASSIEIQTAGGSSRTLQADEFRRIIRASLGESALRSTKFEVHRRRGNYQFEGGGFGHGVGLSQWGAHGMAKAGKSYRDILDFYYTDVRLERRATGSSPTPAAGLLASLEFSAPSGSGGDRLAGRAMPGTRTRASKPATAAVAERSVSTETSSHNAGSETGAAAWAPVRERAERSAGRRRGW